MKRVAFTSITNNYLPKARVLADSVKRYAPEVRFVLFLAEAVDPSLLRGDEPFDEIVAVHDLGPFTLFGKPAHLESWLFCHSLVEACTAIKGRAMARLLDFREETAVLYFDPDIVVTHSLDGLYEEFEQATVLLTPHGVEPENDLQAIVDNEISHLRYGVYNLGFLGVRNTESGTAFSRWWASRLDEFCYDDIQSGLFTDQRWVDLAPSFFEGVRVLRSPAYNVATWNLTHRIVEGCVEDGFQVNGLPMVFYHFSGFDSGAQEIMLARYGVKSPALTDFRNWYIDQCRAMGQDRLGAIPWAFSRFKSGEPVTTAQRRLYRKRTDLQKAFPDPFFTGDSQPSFLSWYNQHAGHCETPKLPVSPYRVVVMAWDEDAADEEALRQLVLRTANRAAIEVAGTKEAVARLSRGLSHLRFREITPEVASVQGRESWMLEQIYDVAETDLIFVQLGLVVPDLWDLRLHLTATRDDSIATASPVYDGVPLTRLGVDELPSADLLDAEQIDQRLFNLDRHTPVDAPSFLYECCCIRHAASRAVFSGRLRVAETAASWPSSLSAFSQSCIRTGFAHVIAKDLFVGIPPEGHRDVAVRPAEPLIERYAVRDIFCETRRDLANLPLVESCDPPTVCQRAASRRLHVTHSWGGGLEHWMRSFCRSDVYHVNMVLKPVGGAGEWGSGLELYPAIDATEPVERWRLPVPIKATAPFNLTYRRIIEGIVEDYGLDAVLVSTLIGHSMDVLRTRARTLFICHDYFPLTPAIYLRSRQLSGNRVVNFSLDDLFQDGPLSLFPNFLRAEAIDASRAFREIIASRAVTLVAPCESTRQIYLDMVPDLNPDDIHVIPHGTVAHILDAQRVTYEPHGRLRVVIIGRAAPEKGSLLAGRLLPRLAEIADVLLIGCGLDGQHLADIPGVQAILRYDNEKLPGILEKFRPHLGLMLSDFPETFSYVLDELLALGVPPLAVRIGSFCDRIADGTNGFLADNDAAAVLDAVRRLDTDRARLESVRGTLEQGHRRTEADMLREYEQLLGLPRFSGRALDGRRLPPSAYRQVPPHTVSSMLLTEVAGPTIRAVCDEYCVLNGKEILLHPPSPGESDTELIFPGILLDGAVGLSAEVLVDNELAPRVTLWAAALDAGTGEVLESAEVTVAAGEMAGLELRLAGLPRLVDIVLRSRVDDGETNNSYAWLKIRNPQITFDG